MTENPPVQQFATTRDASKEALLNEPSFVDAIGLIEAAADLHPSKKTHWSCSLRQIASWLDRPLALCPARLTAIRMAMDDLHFARVGVTAKTLSNHRSNVRAALGWMRKEHNTPARGTPLQPEWSVLLMAVQDQRARARLSGFVRYCSAKGIMPEGADDASLKSYLEYRRCSTLLISTEN